MTGCHPNVHRTYSFNAEMFSGTEGRAGVEGGGHCQVICWSKVVTLRVLVLWRRYGVKKHCLCPSEPQNTRCIVKVNNSIWPHHPWVESVQWHFASRKCCKYRLPLPTFMNICTIFLIQVLLKPAWEWGRNDFPWMTLSSWTLLL